MQAAYLIDSIVRQATVLIAQVATTAGLRAPLAHVANRVFLDLVTEIERQGVSRKVVADMFGLALRSYQQKVQRLSESVTDSGQTLWEAVFSFLQEHEVASREQVLARFSRDDDASVRSILTDLVESGLVYKTGRGRNVVFRVTSEEDLGRMSEQRGSGGLQAIVWLRVHREGAAELATIAEGLRAEPSQVQEALESLIADGRVSRQPAAQGGPLYRSEQCLIPMEDPEGWEAALVDHLQMVTAAICAKLRNGQTRAHPAEEIGGSSYTFDLWDGHPAERRVRSLLAQTRAQIGELWSEVSAHNRQQPTNRLRATRVHFYFGQYPTALTTEEGEDS